jgi:hypothetical protein
VAVLAVLALLALALTLPRVLASDALCARLSAPLESALARELRYERLEFAGLSPTLRMIAPRIAGDVPASLPFAEAPSVALHLAPGAWRLTPGAWREQPLWIDRLDVAGATLRLAGVAGDLAALGELRDLSARLHRTSPDAPVEVEAAFELAGGGSAVARGSATLAGEADLVFTLDGVEIANAAQRLVSGARLAGAVSGTLSLAGPVASPSRVSARLEIAGGELELDALSLRGLLRIAFELAGAPGARSGSFEVDATQAELVVGRSYRKPAGTPATVRGRILDGNAGRLGIDDVKLHIGDQSG